MTVTVRPALSHHYVLVCSDGTLIGRRGHALRSWTDKKGYQHVSLYVDGKSKRFARHVLVAEAFHGPRPEGMEVRHLNGVPGDCRAVNLAWGSQAQNMADRVRLGTQRGVLNPHAKLTDHDIVVIRELADEGLRHREIAAIFGVDRSTISHILAGRAWGHVPERAGLTCAAGASDAVFVRLTSDRTYVQLALAA